MTQSADGASVGLKCLPYDGMRRTHVDGHMPGCREDAGEVALLVLNYIELSFSVYFMTLRTTHRPPEPAGCRAAAHRGRRRRRQSLRGRRRPRLAGSDRRGRPSAHARGRALPRARPSAPCACESR